MKRNFDSKSIKLIIDNFIDDNSLSGGLNNVKIQGQAGVLKDIPDNKQIQGTPAIEFNDYYRSYAYFKKLPDFENRLKKIEKK